MNRFEFIASGYMLFGSAWKTDLANTLGMSAKSNSVAKIAKGERGVTPGVERDIISHLERRAQQLLDAAQLLKNPQKHLIKKEQFNVITFDEEGVRQWDGFQEFPIPSIGVVLYNGDLGVSEADIALYSTIIAAAGAEALSSGCNHDLIKLIPEYFDLQNFPDFDLNVFKIDPPQSNSKGK